MLHARGKGSLSGHCSTTPEGLLQQNGWDCRWWAGRCWRRDCCLKAPAASRPHRGSEKKVEVQDSPGGGGQPWGTGGSKALEQLQQRKAAMQCIRVGSSAGSSMRTARRLRCFEVLPAHAKAEQAVLPHPLVLACRNARRRLQLVLVQGTARRQPCNPCAGPATLCDYLVFLALKS